MLEIYFLLLYSQTNTVLLLSMPSIIIHFCFMRITLTNVNFFCVDFKEPLRLHSLIDCFCMSCILTHSRNQGFSKGFGSVNISVT